MELPQRWFDDYTVGETFETGEHEMTAERIMSFAAEFDPQRFHVDPVAAEASPFGGLIASGWHTAAVLMKLLATTLGPASLGSPGVDELRWLTPVRPGDRLHLRVTVLEARPSGSKPDRGIMIQGHELVNHDGVVVMTMRSTMLLARRPQTEG